MRQSWAQRSPGQVPRMNGSAHRSTASPVESISRTAYIEAAILTTAFGSVPGRSTAQDLLQILICRGVRTDFLI